MSELDCKTYSVFEIHPRATPKPSLTSRDHLHGRRRSRCCQGHACSARTLYCVSDVLYTGYPVTLTRHTTSKYYLWHLSCLAVGPSYN